jgi:uncharacterized membrane protein YcaP (DUF421 family)
MSDAGHNNRTAPDVVVPLKNHPRRERVDLRRATRLQASETLPMLELFDQILGLTLKSEQLGYGQMAARAAVMYLLLIVIVRSAKKRFLSNATAFDFILTVMVGSVAARAMTGGAPFFPATLAIVVMVLMHWIFSRVARESPAFSGLIKGHSTVLVTDGQVDLNALKNAHMSRDDLDEDLREKSIGKISGVLEARLERSGKLSVIKK